MPETDFSITMVTEIVGAGSDALMWRALGNLYDELPWPLACAILVVCSMLCGAVIGQERRSREKPAGRRTMALIAVGSTIFTIASLLIADDGGGDRGRIAAQIVTGIGFLGAGAIIREGTHVIGMTTGATIWATAAIGLLIGSGYAAGGLGLTALVLGMLVLLRDHPPDGE